MKDTNAYSEMSKIYDSKRDKSAYFRIIEGITKRCIKESISSLKGKKVLDAGCGTGRNISTFLELGAEEVYGFDYTLEMLEFAKKRFSENPKVKLSVGDVQNLNYKDEFFDVTGCFKALAHVPNIQKAVNELARVTKKEGLLFLEFYSPYSFRRLFSPVKKHFTRWDSISSAKKIIENAGLKPVKIYGSRTFMITEQLVSLPGTYLLFNFLENFFTNTFLNRFSGYYIIVCKKVVYNIYKPDNLKS